MFQTGFNALNPQIMRITVDSIVGDEPFAVPQNIITMLGLENIDTINGLLIAGAAILIFTVIAGVCDYISRMGTAKCSEGFIKRMRDELFCHIQKLPYSWHTDHSTGDIIQRCISDVTVIRNFVSTQFLQVIKTLFLVSIYFSIMFSMNVQISIVALCFVPIVVAYTLFFRAQIAHRFLQADEAEGELTTVVQENLTGVRVVRAFGREKHETEQFNEKNNNWAHSWINLGKVSSVYWATSDLITGLQILTVLTVGVVFAVRGDITQGELIAFMSYNMSMVWPVRALGRVLSEMSKAGVSVERVQYILNAEQEENSEKALKPAMTGDIVFKNVTFAYSEKLSPVLKNASFTVPAGKTFAILGRTGSGKSTMMHLLDRLYKLPENCGKITIGGVDINDIDLAYLRSNIGIVLQEPFLFSRTIKENISAVNLSATYQQIKDVAKTACIHTSIKEMADGYDTIVGEKGVTLSGGQKQRVAIARMLLKNAPIKIFDDSLSAVDSNTDAEIRKALAEHEENSTVVLISHRVTTLMQADEILVLDEGKIVQQGTHDELIKADGIYKQIYDIQMNSEDRALVERGVENACETGAVGNAEPQTTISAKQKGTQENGGAQ